MKPSPWPVAEIAQMQSFAQVPAPYNGMPAATPRGQIATPARRCHTQHS